MRFVSTRDASLTATLSGTIEAGLAPDGGLYVPEQLPTLAPDDLTGADSLPAIGARVLRPFAAGDRLGSEIAGICREAFTFPAPLVPLDRLPDPASVLELFHGPTSAFKDFGARFLAASLQRVRAGQPKVTILVATSGDTGAAVASAFHGAPWAEVVLLYPKGLVSPRQAHQLSCWGDNVRTFAVHGTFDDCQRMVKEAFRDAALARTHVLSSANSISLGRLLPQMVYYAQASLAVWREEGRRPNVIVPTGNLGNAAACVLARAIGLPIGEIVLATNRNRTIPDYLETGEWLPRRSVTTLASAMDVGSPSNMERLRWMFPDVEALRAQLTAHPVTDGEIRARIRLDAAELGYVWCPHGATAADVYRRLPEARRRERWILVATAHPAKFAEIVEPLVGGAIDVPPALAALLRRPRREQELAPTLDALRPALAQPS